LDACSCLGEVAKLPQEIKQSSQQKEGRKANLYCQKTTSTKGTYQVYDTSSL